MRKTLSTRLAVLFGAGALFAAACGDNNKPSGDDDDDDTVPIDAEVPDTEPPPVYTGTITVLEASVFGAPLLGQGIQVGISFFENGGVAPVYEEMPGGLTGCKVWEYTPAQAADVGSDEGVVTITIDNPEAHGFDPSIPACAFVPGRGYLCPDATQSTGGAIQGVADPENDGSCLAGRLMLVDTDAPFTFDVTDGRYVAFQNSGTELLPDGATLPIIGKVPSPPAPAENTAVVLAYPQATATCIESIPLDDAAVHMTLGGIGPIPGMDNGNSTAPGLLADDADVTVTLTSGGGAHIGTFTAEYTAPAGPGNDFALDTESVAIFTPGGIPLDGSAFTVACDTSAGCGTGSGDGVVLTINTTDADLEGVTATTLPPPETKKVSIRCAALGVNTVTVNAETSAYLMNSGATKLQATFVRGELSGNPEGTVNVVAGHAITTFHVVPEPTKPTK